MKKYDCVVIGAGHNGLICAAYLAKAGKSVCVVERRSIIGGCTTTEELWPGYKVSTASYVVSLLLPEIIRDLKLKENGLEILPRNPSSFTPMKDGRYLLLGPDTKTNQAEISKFSEKDAAAFPKYEAFLTRVAEKIEPMLSRIAPDVLPVSKSMRKIGFGKKMGDLRSGWNMFKTAGALAEDMPETIELMTGAAKPILERWFESEIVKATLATDAIIGAFLAPSTPGSAYVLLHHVMGSAGGARGVWGYVQGGMGQLSESIATTCRQLGVDIMTDSAVEKICVENNKTTGVVLENGQTISASIVSSSVDANWTWQKLTDDSELPDSFRQAVSRIDYSSASLKINLALSEPPIFTSKPDGANGTNVGPQHHGTMHIGETVDGIERAYDQAKYGIPSNDPIIEMTMPTAVDKTIAPEGKHIIGMFVQYAPYELADGKSWDDIKDIFADRCIERLAEYAPNVPASIEHRQVLSPLDLERDYGLTGGNIFQGSMSLNQLMMLRPVIGWADHRCPIKGLYLCGAASHPGGGVMGACGKNAAQVILKDN